MCGVKLMDEKTLMGLLGLAASIEMTTTANALRWFGHVPRTEKNSALKVALGFEVLEKRERTSKEHMKRKS